MANHDARRHADRRTEVIAAETDRVDGRDARTSMCRTRTATRAAAVALDATCSSATAESELGEDGHPVVGIPAPPGPGSPPDVRRRPGHDLRPLRIGRPATKVTSIAKSVDKIGTHRAAHPDDRPPGDLPGRRTDHPGGAGHRLPGPRDGRPPFRRLPASAPEDRR